MNIPISIEKFLMIIFLLAEFGMNLMAQYKNHEPGSNFLSFSSGIGYFSFVNDDLVNRTLKKELEGSAVSLDIKYGGSLNDYLCWHMDMILHSSLSMDVTRNGRKLNNMVNENSLAMSIIGMGITKYTYSGNFFVSATLGLSSFSYDESGTSINTQWGMGFYSKIGKEWQITNKWGVGLCLWSDLNYAAYETLEFYGTAFGLSVQASTNWFIFKSGGCYGCW